MDTALPPENASQDSNHARPAAPAAPTQPAGKPPLVLLGFVVGLFPILLVSEQFISDGYRLFVALLVTLALAPLLVLRSLWFVWRRRSRGSVAFLALAVAFAWTPWFIRLATIESLWNVLQYRVLLNSSVVQDQIRICRGAANPCVVLIRSLNYQDYCNSMIVYDTADQLALPPAARSKAWWKEAGDKASIDPEDPLYHVFSLAPHIYSAVDCQ